MKEEEEKGKPMNETYATTERIERIRTCLEELHKLFDPRNEQIGSGSWSRTVRGYASDLSSEVMQGIVFPPKEEHLIWVEETKETTKFFYHSHWDLEQTLRVWMNNHGHLETSLSHFRVRMRRALIYVDLRTLMGSLRDIDLVLERNP